MLYDDFNLKIPIQLSMPILHFINYSYMNNNNF